MSASAGLNTSVIIWEYTAYGHEAKVEPAVTAVVIYGLFFLAHLIQAIKFRAAYMIPLVLGVALETVGFGVRIISIHSPYNSSLYSSQIGLVIIAPVFIAASQYLILSRIIEKVNPAASPLRHSIITAVFVTADLVSFCVQVTGSVMLIVDKDLLDMGTDILIAGTAFQVVSYCCFLYVGYTFYKRALAAEKDDGKTYSSSQLWRYSFLTLISSGICVLLRSTFRVFEFSWGFRSYLATTEAFMYVFDFTLVSLALLALNLLHPGKLLSKSS
ncbi:hypothetical protein HDU83_005299 [Entophlyctis luteolus]|nr:hypothetical protein HDU83_005299 [Entophlyctis luteolus]